LKTGSGSIRRASAGFDPASSAFRFSAPAARRLPIRTSHAAILAAWCGVLFLYGAAAGPPYRTEALRAIIGRECLHGHWLFPVLYGEPFLTKPPGHYAAIGLCSLPFGDVTPATARLPSVLAASATVFLVYFLFRRALGERAALLAALLLPTSVLWLDKVPSAEIDMTLVGWVTAALVFLHRALDTDSARWWVLSLLCVAGGTLTKWTAPAFFALTAGPLLAWRGELRRLFGWRFLLAAGAAGAVCAGWVFAVSQQVGWDALFDTVRKEAAYRFAPKGEAKGYPWSEVVTYPLVVLAAHLPVSAFALLTLRPGFAARWGDDGRRLLQLLHCWAWPNLVFWALVPNHNVRYALPVSPALMGLGVMGLIAAFSRDAESSERSAPRPALPFGSRLNGCVVLFLAAWLAAKVAFVERVIPARAARRDPGPPAAELRARVPAGEPLYLFRLKDEGVMFMYARPAVRLRHPRDLPPGAFAVLIRPEWEDRTSFGHLKLVHWMLDQQGDPLILVQNP
jgi:4-amino-4-deoxy-L-arabinose transferase-like glycosyltransferase